ncbi:hypothetical protein D9615_001300 [Tricholomella constricta]|uniref:Homeobox domain-containing protein n=1 Tax=Tricholomella constricta TaxID=117010 RepID=A0A8H5M8S9_9AGAR|nr:hypothetical protein D9615_001300 [Tricholomella constricta]
MDNDIDTQFLQRISLIEKELLELNRTTIDNFHHRWTALVDDLTSAIDAESLKASTITIAYTLSNRVSHVFQTFLDLEALADKLMASLLDETSSTPNPLTTDIPPPSELSTLAAVPPYIKPSYNWLLENIHDPYPSTRARDGIAQKSGASRKDVDNWFIDARKRIGWNALRKASFSNKRADIVDAATRFFVEDVPERPIDPTIEYELVAIKKRAQDLYCDKFTESTLATKLDVAVKNLTPQTKAEAKAERLRQLQLQKDKKSYPSPERSPERSPEPTRLSPVAYKDDDGGFPQPISITSRKRRSPSSEPPESNEDSSTDRPIKRSRLDASTPPPQEITFSIGLPSPASSLDEPLQTLIEAAPSAVPTRPNRKRRLSDSDGQGAPKRPRNLPVGPRLQSVSDPLPLSSALFDASAFDGWFLQHFDFQAAPNAGTISPSGFDVELGNLSDFEYESQTESGSSSPQLTPQTFEPPTIEVTSISSESHKHTPQMSTGFTFEDLETLLSSDAIANFPNQVTPTAQDLSAPQIPSLGLDFFHNFTLPFQQTESIHPSMTDSSVPSCDFQWEFSDFLNIGTQAHASDADTLLDVSQNGLGFLPSIGIDNIGDYMMPSGVNYFAPSQAEVRAEKEAKLKMMKEEALKLELELAAS